MRYCERCDQLKPPRTHHCRLCRVCIHKMDHHCHWVNNCIGYYNHKFFLLFLFYTFLSSFLGSCIIGVSLYYSFTSDTALNYFQLFMLLLTAVESVIFLLYTWDFLYEQIGFVLANQTTI